MKLNYLKIITFLAFVPLSLTSRAELTLDYEGSVSVGAGVGGDFAPYYISSLEHGRYSQQFNVQAEAAVWHSMDTTRRFSYAFGLDLIGGYASSVEYERYNVADQSWYTHPEHPSRAWVQQIYGALKYRSLFLEAGARERGSALLNQRLTSGDLIESGNARPIPQVRAGFIDFQNIPFTNGWVQLQGEVGYGYLLDDNWWENHYNYYNYHISKKTFYNYKRLYFRTKPSERFSLTIGMQAAGQFGGEETFYINGKKSSTYSYPHDLKTFFKMLIPRQDGGEGFYTGNHLGCWDIRGRYRLRDGKEVFAYVSWPWEDGSGIGKLNGWDGLWGLEYKANRSGFLTGAVVEYLDFTNQSGPIHYAPADYEGTTVNDHASGSDDYYNNRAHNSYAYYGMSIGTPALMAPIYNISGYPAYRANVMRGFHIAFEGTLHPGLDYRVKGGYRKAWGSGYFMLPEPIHLTAFMLEANWHPARVKGFTVNGRLELDRGNMSCNQLGAMVTVKYNGFLKF